jgi:hypothetical protein
MMRNGLVSRPLTPVIGGQPTAMLRTTEVALET